MCHFPDNYVPVALYDLRIFPVLYGTLSACRRVETGDIIIIAGEKQATRCGICFSAIINEKAFDEVKHRARQRGLSSMKAEIMSKQSAREAKKR